jgi:Ca2+-binding EF-hand superfamily protein
MLKKQRIGLGALAIATLLATGTTAWARGDNLPQPHSPAVLAEDQVKQLIQVLDQGNNRTGTVSKEEFMKFVSSEFDRFEHDRAGNVQVQDLREVRQTEDRPTYFSSGGK